MVVSNEPDKAPVARPDMPLARQFLNRELSLIEFNRRVLAQAENEETPLLERLRFICIVSSNLDEFFEVRIAGLKEQIKLDSRGLVDGMSPSQTFEQVSGQVHALIARQYQLLNDIILPALVEQGICFCGAMSGTTASVNGSGISSFVN